MKLNSLLPSKPTNHDWRLVLVGVALTVGYGYAGIKLSLMAGEFRMLTGAVGGVLFGLYVRRLHDCLEYAVVAAVTSIIAMYVVFLIDDFVITSKYDVELPVIAFRGGPLLDRFIAYNVYELLTFLTTGPLVLMTAVLGAWFGWVLRRIVTGLFPGLVE